MAVLAVARTAVRPVDGELAGWNPVELAGVVGREALERAGLDAAELDEVVVGCADPVGACGADAARAVVLAAGWPVSVGGLVVDRAETSGLAAVQTAVAAIRAGQVRTVLVVGLGLCSVVPPGAAALNRTYGAPWGGVAERFAAVGGLLPAPRLSERAAAAAGMDRADLDTAAEESRRRRRASGSNATESDTTQPDPAGAASAGPNTTESDTTQTRPRGRGLGGTEQQRSQTPRNQTPRARPRRDRTQRSQTPRNQTPRGAASAGPNTTESDTTQPDPAGAASAGPNTTESDTTQPDPAGAASAGPNTTESDTTQPDPAGAASAGAAIVAVAARPGAAAARGVYRGDPVAVDFVRDWDNATGLPPAFDDDGLLTAATFAPPADGVAAVLLQARPQPESLDADRAGTTTAFGSAVSDNEGCGEPAELATVVGVGRAAGDPFDPVGKVAAAVGQALGEADAGLEAVDAIAVVEHDAATVGLVARALRVDAERVNRAGGAVATGNAGAAEELRLITDGLASGASSLLLTISAGPTGSAAILWEIDI